MNDVAAKIKQVAKTPSTKILVQPADLSSETSVRQLWDIAAAEVGKIDVLINNAGHMNYAPIGGIEPSEWWNDFVSGPLLKSAPKQTRRLTFDTGG